MNALRRLEPGPPPVAAAPPLAGREHRSRRLLTRLLHGDARAGASLREEYDRQSAEWTAWCAGEADYTAPLEDGLARAGLRADPRRVLEVGCGTGQATALLAARLGGVVASDVSLPMLRGLPRLAGVLPLAADVRALPFAAASLELIVGLNAVPDLAEFARALRPGGRVLWVSSYGDRTPLYVPPEELGARWTHGPATTAAAGHGDWVLLERA